VANGSITPTTIHVSAVLRAVKGLVCRAVPSEAFTVPPGIEWQITS
jgi:hypothetical protein